MVSPENMRGSEDRPPVAEQTADNQSPAEQSIDDSSSEEQSEANNSPINSSEFDMLREEELSSLSTEELLRQREVLEASLEGTRYIAVAGDFSRDKRALAGRHAKGILDRELSTKEKGKLFDKLGKRIFRKYYERKYTRDLVSGEMKVTLNDGEEYTLDELIKRDSEAPLSRFVEGINEDLDNGFVGSKYIHSEIGIENKSTGDNAESYEKADARTTQILKGAIEAFADSPDTMKLLEADSGKMSDAFKAAFDKKLHDFYEAANSKLANAGKDQVVLNEFNNYAKVAWDALQTHRHGMAMDKVMQGFAVYNAKVRDGARSESHREHLDNILVALDSRHLTFAADAVAVGAGVWATLARTGSRMLFGVAAGGAVTSAVLGGIRTHDRYTSTRAEMFYDAELGGDNTYAGKTDKEIKAMRLKGRERYEAKIGNTVYEMKKATDLIDSIDKAFDGDDSEAILQAIADARIRIDLSDRTQKSLIAYTKGKVGDERLALDMTVIKLENALSGIGKERYEVILDEVKAKIKEETEATDRNFNTKRRRAVIGKIAASATFSLGSYFLSQEIKAAFDGETAGLYDTLRKTPAASTAKKETVLTKLFAHGKYESAGAPGKDMLMDEPITKEGFAKLHGNSDEYYLGDKISDTGTDDLVTNTRTAWKSPLKSAFRRKITYEGWADNGTRAADGNELRIRLKDGQFTSKMFGTSTFNGEKLDVAGNNVKAFITIGDAKFEVAPATNAAGERVWGENGVFTIIGDNNERTTVKAIGDNGEKLYKYFEVAVVRNPDAEVQRIIPLATDVGKNTFSETIQETVTNVTPASNGDELYQLFKRATATSEFVDRATAVAYGAPFAAPLVDLYDTLTSDRPTASTSVADLFQSPTPPTAPTESPATTPETPSPAPESEEERQNSANQIFINSYLDDTLGGSDAFATRIFASDAPTFESPEERDRAYRDWWNNLGLAEQNLTAVLLNNIEYSSSDQGFGRDFLDWLLQYDNKPTTVSKLIAGLETSE